MQGSTALWSGDLVVLFTDGISESMNAGDEEWGEARLSAAIAASNNGLAITTVLNKLLESADARVSPR